MTIDHSTQNLRMFSKRTGWDLAPNALAQQKAALEKEGVRLLDLTGSNPTRAGFEYPDHLLPDLSKAQSLDYSPDPKGELAARQAVASIYAGKGCPVRPEQILLTASTSEAYGFLFQLLADPGDEILVPVPSYPLFSYLADLAGLRTVAYPLSLQERWQIDWVRLENALTQKSRAIVAVSPNNPTGSCLTREELTTLKSFCRANGLALIADEVFAEYRFLDPAPEDQAPRTLLGGAEVLTFALGGLSKWMGLPQMKLAWIAAEGPQGLLDPALKRLEVIGDTALSVNGPVQRAFPGWGEAAAGLQGQIRSRIRTNRSFLEETLRSGPWRLLPAEGGWSAVLLHPGIRDEEEWVLSLMRKKQLLLHPGFLFDFRMRGIGVVSLLTPPETFREGIRRLNE